MSQSRKRTSEEKKERALREIVESEHLRRAFFAFATKQGLVSKTSMRMLMKAGLVRKSLRFGQLILTPLGREVVEKMAERSWRRWAEA